MYLSHSHLAQMFDPFLCGFKGRHSRTAHGASDRSRSGSRLEWIGRRGAQQQGHHASGGWLWGTRRRHVSRAVLSTPGKTAMFRRVGPPARGPSLPNLFWLGGFPYYHGLEKQVGTLVLTSLLEGLGV